MIVFTEDPHAEEFILSEANDSRSRENGTLVSGQNLKAGTLVQDNGSGKLTAYTGTANTAGDLITQAKGILLRGVDATDGDVAVAYLARDAEVNGKLITFPDEATADVGDAKASLELLGIIVR